MAKQKNPKSPAELYNLFLDGDSILGPWLRGQTDEQNEMILAALHLPLGEPIVVFERIFAGYYCNYLVADEGTDEEFLWFALTRMLGHEYENYYRKVPKFLTESVTSFVAHIANGGEGPYCSPSDPATLNPHARKASYSLPRYDPRGREQLDKKTPASFEKRISAHCESCDEVEHHDDWTVILGTWAGVTSIGRQGTFGKVGKRTRLRVCARCGTLTVLET